MSINTLTRSVEANGTKRIQPHPPKTSAVCDHGRGQKTQGEIEAAICRGMSKFEQEYMGRGPKDVRAHLIGDLLVVHLQDVLTAAERHLVSTVASEKGRELLKQIRSRLLAAARSALESLVEEITGVKVHSLHHDISTVTGEEMVVFSLLEAPDCRQPKKRQSHQQADGDSSLTSGAARRPA